MTCFTIRMWTTSNCFVPVQVSRGLNWKLDAQLVEVSSVHCLWATPTEATQKVNFFGCMRH